MFQPSPFWTGDSRFERLSPVLQFDLEISRFQGNMSNFSIFCKNSKKFLTWTFWGQNVGPTWVENGKKYCFYTSHLTMNPVFPKTKFLTATVS